MSEHVPTSNPAEEAEAESRYWFLDELKKYAATGIENVVLLSNTDFLKARNDNEFFKVKMTDVIRQYPHLIFSFIRHDEYKKLFTADEIRENIQKSLISRPDQILSHLSYLPEYYPTVEDRQKLLLQAAQQPDSSLMLLNSLDEPELSFLREKAEWSQIFIQAILKSGISFLPSIRDALNDGTLDKKLIAKAAEAATKKGNANNGIDLAMALGAAFPDCFSPDEWDKLKTDVKVFLQKKNDSAAFYFLENAKAFLTTDELKAIVQDYLEIFPRQAPLMLEIVHSVIGQDGVEAWIDKALDKEEIANLTTSQVAENILTIYLKTPALRKKYLLTLIEKYPNTAIKFLRFLPEAVPADQIKAAALKLLDTISPSQMRIYRYEITDLLGIPDADVMQVLKNKINAIDNLREYVQALQSATSSDADELATSEEFVTKMKSFILPKSDELRWQMKYFLEVSKELFQKEDVSGPLKPETTQAIRSVLDVFKERSPSDWLASMYDIHVFYNAEEITSALEEITTDVKSIRTAINAVSEWGNLVGKEYTEKWLIRHVPSSALEQMNDLKQTIPFISEQNRKSYVELLEEHNPAAATLIELSGGHLTKYLEPPGAWQRAKSINSNEQVLPQMFKQFKDSAERSSKTPGVYEADLNRWSNYFRNMGIIEEAGFLPLMKVVIEKSADSVKNEERCLHLFLALSLLSQTESFSTDTALETLDDLETKIFDTLNRRMQIDPPLSSDQRQRFSQEMGGISAFTTYFVQYEKSPQHLVLLKQIFLAIANGEFRAWKYGTVDQFIELKTNKLIPSEISSEQYQTWQEDDETTSIETLSVSNEAAAHGIQNIIRNNTEHLYLSDFLEKTSSVENALKLVADRQQKSGQELASINKELKRLRDAQAPQADIDLQIEEQQRVTLERDYFKLVKYILMFAQIKPEEVAVGYFIKGENKTDNISKTLQEISSLLQTLSTKGFERDDLDIILLGTVSSYLEELKNSGQQSKQKLVTTDSSSPKVFLEVGNNPVESCQNYSFGEFNECLLGYSEPMTKVLTVTNEKGNIVARSIFRLLTAAEGNAPALHVETIYATTASETVIQLLHSHAVKKAEKMGVKVYISKEAQNELGVAIKAESTESITHKTAYTKLRSNNSRAPLVYVDSAGGKIEKGDYEIRDLLELGIKSASIEEAIEQMMLGVKRATVEKNNAALEVIPVNKETDLGEVVEFYNKYLPDSPHSKEFKQQIYEMKSISPIVLQVRMNGEMVGLLEAWTDQTDPTQKVLATLIVRPDYQGRGMAKKLFARAKAEISSDSAIQTWVVHFRGSKKNQLAEVYTSLGFTNLKDTGSTYNNGDPKWEMVAEAAKT